MALALMISGCASAPKTKTIAIDSDPQGVRVEVNGEDLGKTPTTYSVRTNPEGEFLGSWANAPQVEFTAYPPPNSTGLYKQVKVFQPNGFFKARSHSSAHLL
jgi:hypothetical protein